MELWTKDKIRQTFKSYFESQNNTFIKQSSLVPPHNDKSILFTNSGMNQFKPIFMGMGEPIVDKAYNIQRCLRAGGKHNDFDQVGKDTYHHSMFEMMGNWQFNCTDNEFKTNAIDHAWNLLINIYGLDPNRMYVTYYAGNDQVPTDTETSTLWKKYLPDERILPFEKENFWEMAETGSMWILYRNSL